MKACFDTVLFDMDGTLLDSKAGIISSIRRGLSAGGYTVPAEQELLWVVGPPIWDVYRKLLGDVDSEQAQTAIDAYRKHYHEHGKYDAQLFDGVIETLAALREHGCRLMVATSKMETTARDILEHFKLACHFDAIYGALPDRSRDNKGLLLRELLRLERVDTTRAVMIGDRHHDIDGARANNLAAWAVSYGYGSAQELAEARPDRILRRMREVAELVCG